MLGGREAIESLTIEQLEIDNRWIGNVIESLKNFDRTLYALPEIEKIVLFLFKELEIKAPRYKPLREAVEDTYYNKGGLL